MKAKYIYLMMAGAFLLASCNNEDTPLQAGTEPDAPAMNLPEGTFVVDYTASTDGAASRSASDMISSLDYLLYESTDGLTYTLAKRVEIPDIDKDKTAWPLTRANMTWAQREALKDTLNTSNSYKAVFVANAKHDLWGEDVLIGVGDNANFNDARLNLPTTNPFNESNMYFMDVVEINENRNQPDKGSLDKQILLERVINKIEVKLDEDVNADDYVTNQINEYYNQMIDGKVAESIMKYMGKIADNQLKLGLSWGTYHYALDDLKKYLKLDETKTLLITYLKSDEYKITDDSFFSSFNNSVNEDWADCCFWQDGKEVKIAYLSYPNKLTFERKTEASNNVGDPIFYKVNSNAFSYYVFGNNIDNEGDVNKVDKFQFIDTDVSLEGNDFPISEGEKGGNLRFEIKCNPIGKKVEGTNNSYSISINLVEILKLEEVTEDNNWNFLTGDFTGFMNALNNNSSFDNENESMENMTIEFDYPQPIISPTWEGPNKLTN